MDCCPTWQGFKKMLLKTTAKLDNNLSRDYFLVTALPQQGYSVSKLETAPRKRR
jgi:hypothetical protein